MRIMSSLAATVVGFFLPSQSKQVSLGKLALIGMLVTTFFLFTSAYNFPGGATHYPNWAEAIINGTKLPVGMAQREVGFSLIYLLSGFPFTHSFIGLTLILAVFAVLMSMLVYWCLEDISPSIAYVMGLACIASLSPYTYLKFFYPDQAYIFFNLLSVTLVVKYIHSKSDAKYLYLFTLVALFASFTRTAGNLMYPMLLVIAYLSARGRLMHYGLCILIFALGTGLYQWHRYEIFDMAHQESRPSGKGMQILYSTYLYLGDFGYKLSPEFGPNTKRLLDKMRKEIGSNVRKSPLIRQGSGDSPPEFMEKNFYAYTPEQLYEKIVSEPNEEYYWNVVYALDTDDQFFLDVAKEIMKSNPWYVVQYSMRNMWHAVFKPGYATTRYNTLGYGHIGNDYVPAILGYGAKSEDPVEQYGQRAVNEMKYFPVEHSPQFIRSLFYNLQQYYLVNFDRYVAITSLLILFAWSAALIGIYSLLFPNKRFSKKVKQYSVDKLATPIVVVSSWVLYEDLLTSLFCQPVYRYFHLTEPMRIVVAGFGLIFLAALVSRKFRQSLFGGGSVRMGNGFLAIIQKKDLLNNYFEGRTKIWFALLVGLNIALFLWWTLSMIAHTS